MREFEPVTVERLESKKKYSLSLEEVRKIAKEGAVIPIYRTLPGNLDTPFGVYLKVQERRGGEENESRPFSPSMLLESSPGGESVARYSYICINPKETIRVTANEISITNRDGAVSTQSGERIDPLKAMQEKVSKTVVKSADVPSFSGGYVGYLGYEVAGAFESRIGKSKPDPIGAPEAVLCEYDSVIAYDHPRKQIKVIGNINVDSTRSLEEQYREVSSNIDTIVDRITNTPITVKTKVAEGEIPAGKMQSNFERETYMNRIRRIKEYLEAGDAIQVVLSQRWARETTAQPDEVYDALMQINPSPFMFYMEMVDRNNRKVYIIGASPELLFKVEDGTVTTWPIAGTRPRGRTSEEDAQFEAELISNEKERAEHVMLVDLGRNDIGRISKPGTVKVEELMLVKKYASVMHLASKVSGQLADGLTSLDALRSLFPAGTVSGAPKIRAMEIIYELEDESRGIYAGGMGYFGYGGDAELAIAIRTIVYKENEDKKGGTVFLQAGGGIVYDSDPLAEYEETIAKTRGSASAIDKAEQGF